MTGNDQQRFTKRKLCLVSVITISDMMTSCVDER